jgi:hypothetical protein
MSDHDSFLAVYHCDRLEKEAAKDTPDPPVGLVLSNFLVQFQTEKSWPCIDWAGSYHRVLRIFLFSSVETEQRSKLKYFPFLCPMSPPSPCDPNFLMEREREARDSEREFLQGRNGFSFIRPRIEGVGIAQSQVFLGQASPYTCRHSHPPTAATQPSPVTSTLQPRSLKLQIY